jgi:hypothetical protein
MEAIYGDIESLEEREAKEIAEYNRKNNMNNNFKQNWKIKKIQQVSQHNVEMQ